MATKHLVRRTVATTLSAYALLSLAGCGSGGSDGATGPAGPSGPPGPGQPVVIEPYDPLPGVNAAIVGTSGGSGSGGALRVGDFLTVRFTAETNDATPLDVPSLARGSIYLSGPSNNYQRVLLPQSDVAARSVYQGSGVWSYTFLAPIPALYPAPLNDTAAFGLADGELKGTSLLDGTYTIGLELRWDYTTSEGATLRDAGVATHDVLFGSAPTISHREVVANANCNVCHTELRVHGDNRKDVRLCVLCHTAGSEDGNPSGATPGVSVEFKVMIHKIHNAAHLPSVLGISTDASGNRVYPTGAAGSPSATVVNLPQPLEYSGFGGNLVDLSEVVFPVWPNFNVAMPRDAGYSALASTAPTVPVGYTGPTLLSQRAAEDATRTGVTACAKCHGDPDAGLDSNGPLTAPAQGNLHRTNPTRAACGSCHDDIDWAKPYTANGQTMAANLADNSCASCHTDTAANQPTSNYQALSVTEAHLHPLNNPALDPGVNSVITTVTGGTGPQGQLQNGESPTVTLTLKNDAGANIGLATMDSCSAFFFGPNTNRQLIMPLTSPNGQAISPFDFGGRLHATSTSNKGSMSKQFLGSVAETLTVEFTSATAYTVTGSVSGALGGGTLAASPSTNPTGSSVAGFELAGITASETLTIAFTSATAFTVTGSSSGLLGSGTLPNNLSASTRFTSPKVSFNLTVGTTAAVAGNQFNCSLFKGSGANPVLFAIVAGKTSFAAKDRFYYEIVPNAATYTFKLPMDMTLEYLGDGDGNVGQALTAGNLPVYFGRQQVWEAALSSPTTTTTAAVAMLGRKVAVSPVAGFANGDTVVIEPTSGVGVREYAQISPEKADGVIAGAADVTAALNFKTPLRYAHAGGVTITKVALSFKQEGAANDYTLNPATGVLTSVTARTAGVGVVATYRTDGRFGYFRHPGDARQTYYVPPANDSTAIGQEQGDWQGLPYQSGTYTADVWFAKRIDYAPQNELLSYQSTSNAGTKDFLYGTATTIVPHSIISSQENANCYTCHNDLIFHGGGRRGLDACLTCHGVSAEEDKPRWDTATQANKAPAVVPTELTPGVGIEFRQMLHKIHKGSELYYASSYTVVGNGGNSSQYGEVGFPAQPQGVKQCVRCHGNDAWQQPAPRSHASATVPVRIWGTVCSSCHDSPTAGAHISSNTTSGAGVESCEVCHGPGKVADVAKVHTPR